MIFPRGRSRQTWGLQMKAVANTFYGVFPGNGVPFGRPFSNIDPIFFKATVNPYTCGIRLRSPIRDNGE